MSEGLRDRLDGLRGHQSVAAFAAKCGVGASTMQQYLAPNGSIPSAEKALRIADVCGVSVEWLIAGRGPREPAAAPPQMEGQPQPNGATLAEQIACIKREIAMRRNVYPKWVHSGRMRHDVATREMNAIEAVLRTLEACQLIASGSVKS